MRSRRDRMVSARVTSGADAVVRILVMKTERPADPDWSAKIRHAAIGLGCVWLVFGAGVAMYYAVTDRSDDIVRGVLAMLLGAATATVGLLSGRRHSR